MIGILVSILFIIWFFISAKNVGKNPWGWAGVGFLSYYIPVVIWGFILKLILPGLGIRISSSGGALAFGLAIGLSAVLVGAVCAYLVRAKILLKN
ncbi:MAG: hypothetical protein GY797_18490 [Deltaproteobacteria bacterium]|nr:hypothetical protein [Deltaproteobacteria bacterium]